MKKLNAIIHYECATSFKYIWIFYGIMFAVVSIIWAIVCISTGSFDQVGTNSLEINSMIYMGVLGILGFKDDFKTLIQNGFTRKYIYLGTFCMFAFVSGIMSFVDTVVGNVLHTFLKSSYDSVFGSLYGYGHSVILNWLWLFLVYMLVCSFLYFFIIVKNKIGKTASIILWVTLGLVITLIVPVLVRFVLPKDFTQKIIEFLVRGLGFIDGTINLLYPVLLLIVLTGVISTCSYFVLRSTELKV